MNDRADVLDLLAENRPACFDTVTDPRRRDADRERALLHSRTVEPRPARRPAGRRGISVGLAVAATVVAVTMVTTLAMRGMGDDEGAEGTPASAPKGRFLLLTTESYDLSLAGTQKNSYRVLARATNTDWIPRSDDDNRVLVSSGSLTLPTSEDKAAWKRDGSPKDIRTYSMDKQGDMSSSTGTHLGASGLSVYKDNRTPDEIGPQANSLDDYRQPDLPATPQALETKLLSGFAQAQQDQRSLGEFPADLVSPVTKPQYVLDRAGDLLGVQIDPKLRAAAYQVLASYPGVHNMGTVSDLGHRTGTGFAVTSTSVQGLVERRLVVDPKTSLLLAMEDRVLQPRPNSSWLKPNEVARSTTYLKARWSNDLPPKETDSQ